MRRNRFIKKRIAFIILVFSVLCTFMACQKKELPQPVFPLAEDMIMQEVKKAGFAWVVSQDETRSYQDGHIAYTLRDPTEKPTEGSADTRLWASISSAVEGEERFLFLIFDSAPVSTDGGKTPLIFSWEDWKAQLLLAARLYGGFANEETLYEAFASQEIPSDAEHFAYEAWFPDAYCRISYRTRDTHTVHEFPEAVALSQAGTLRVNIYGSEASYRQQQAKAEEKKAEWERARTDDALRKRLMEELEERNSAAE